MRTAPAVRVVCDLGGAWRWLQALLYGVASAALAAWCALRFNAAMPVVIFVAALVAIAAFVLGMCLLSKGTATLNWSGAAWSLDVGNGAVDLQRVDIMLDLGAALLLRLLPATGRAYWMPVRRRESGAAFPLLCAALYASWPR